jgi:hypothetical protein
VVCSALLRKYVAATEMTRGVISENMEDEDDDSMSVSGWINRATVVMPWVTVSHLTKQIFLIYGVLV